MKTPLSKDAPVVCRQLRAKGAWVPYGEPVTWEAGCISTAIFWCLGTADVLGPDDGFVHPHVCVNGRACFCDQPMSTVDKKQKTGDGSYVFGMGASAQTPGLMTKKIPRTSEVVPAIGASSAIEAGLATLPGATCRLEQDLL